MATTVYPTEHVTTDGEREQLDAFLDSYREIVVGKVAGLAEDAARRPLVTSVTSAAGILKHLRWVEVGWFHQLLGERSGENLRPHPRHTEFEPAPADTLASLTAEYRLACQTSRTITAGFALDDTVPHVRLGPVSVRWVYLHLIEETARHAGQLDILREQLDGATGDG